MSVGGTRKKPRTKPQWNMLVVALSFAWMSHSYLNFYAAIKFWINKRIPHTVYVWQQLSRRLFGEKSYNNETERTRTQTDPNKMRKIHLKCVDDRIFNVWFRFASAKFKKCIQNEFRQHIFCMNIWQRSEICIVHTIEIQTFCLQLTSLFNSSPPFLFLSFSLALP